MRSLLRRAGRWLPWIGLALLAVALYAHRSALARAHDRLDQMRPLALRTEVRDRLIGTDLSHLELMDLHGHQHDLVSGEKIEVIWFVDPFECPRCLASLTEWRRLGQETDVAITTVLLHAGPGQAARMRSRTTLPGRVRIDPEGELGASLGVSPEVPSMYLVLNAQGSVLMSESRQASKSCDWSFPEQVQVLLTEGDAARLRAGSS